MPEKRPILDALNDRQREAAGAIEGPVLVVAGAGSGKTRVICHRIAHLIDGLGVDPRQILAVTFTNKAAGEMVRRVEALTEVRSREMWVSTFHAAAVRILRRDAEAIGLPRDFAILDEADSASMVKRVLEDQGLDPKRHKPARVAEAISRLKDDLVGPERAAARAETRAAEMVARVYAEYEKRMKTLGALDFGGLLAETVRLLDEAPEALERYRRKFRFLHVDEYQDTNRAQYRIVKALAAPLNNIFVVGDPDQAIYKWRGADIRNILEFERDFENARVVVLDRNYRSTAPILDAASHLISRNLERKEKNLWTERSGGAAVRAVECPNEYEEAEWILAEVRRRLAAGTPPSEIAVFYRVHALSRVLEEAFSAAGIPYQVVGSVSFYQRTEVKDVLAYLRIAARPEDEVSLRRVINNPPRGIGDVTVERLSAWATEKGVPLWEAVGRAAEVEEVPAAARRRLEPFVALVRRLRRAAAEDGVPSVLRAVLDETAYLGQYDPDDPEDEARIENVRELLSAAEDHVESGGDPSVGAFLERVALATDVDRMEVGPKVTLMSIHAAKGLEFSAVFLSGMEEGIFPHARVYGGEIEDLEEERRLAYVGMTRAKDLLVATRASERRLYGLLHANPPSRFLFEAALVEASAGPRRRPAAPRRPIPDEDDVAEMITRSARPKGAALGERGYALSMGRAGGAYSPGDRVRHHRFGEGRIVEVRGTEEDETVMVRFRAGTKSLMTKYANLVRV